MWDIVPPMTVKIGSIHLTKTGDLYSQCVDSQKMNFKLCDYDTFGSSEPLIYLIIHSTSVFFKSFYS